MSCPITFLTFPESIAEFAVGQSCAFAGCLQSSPPNIDTVAAIRRALFLTTAKRLPGKGHVIDSQSYHRGTERGAHFPLVPSCPTRWPKKQKVTLEYAE